VLGEYACYVDRRHASIHRCGVDVRTIHCIDEQCRVSS
jgi:hypothetical protein